MSSTEELKWMVTEGDSKTYKISSMYDPQDKDGDGNPNSRTGSSIGEDGNLVEIVLKIGTKIKVEIITLNDSATIQLTYDDTITRARQDTDHFITKTIDNRTYWEKETEQQTEMSVQGNLLVTEQTVEKETIIKKVNWKTGWLEYFYIKDGEAEEGISAVSTGIISGFETIPLFSSILLVIILNSKKIEKTRDIEHSLRKIFAFV